MLVYFYLYDIVYDIDLITVNFKQMLSVILISLWSTSNMGAC